MPARKTPVARKARKPAKKAASPKIAKKIAKGLAERPSTEWKMPYRSLRRMLEERARLEPDKVYIYWYDDTITYGEFNRRVDRLANGLKSLGVKKGDYVHMYMNNSPELMVAVFAALKLGAVAGPVNCWWQTEEIRYVFNDSRAVGVVVDASYASIVQTLRPTCPNLKFVVELGPNPEQGHVPLADLVAKQPEKLAPVEISDKDEAFLFYTSGTTGEPKGALLTHGAVLGCMEGLRLALEDPEEDKEKTPIGLFFLPIFHVNAMMSMISAPHRGISTVLRERFSAGEFGEIVQRYKPHFFSAVPTIYRILLEVKDQVKRHDLSSIKFGLCGAAPMPVELFNRFETEFPTIRILEGYGLTEGTVGSTINPRKGVRKIGSIGRPFPGQEVRILDEKDREVPPGTVGEICIRGPNLMKGYLRKPEATAQTLRGGWLHTGDVGFMDKDGYFFIVDRKKDMIIRGGEKVFPVEVDNCLVSHPKVKEAACIGVKSEHYGEEVKAFVVLREGQTATPEEIQAFCTSKLAEYKVPSFVEFVDYLPKNPVGKTLRKELRRQEATR